jgi:hypothetical protein
MNARGVCASLTSFASPHRAMAVAVTALEHAVGNLQLLLEAMLPALLTQAA